MEAIKVNPKFKYEINKIPGAENIMLCFQCGTCTAGCPIARFSDFYKPRTIVRMVQLGLRETLLSEKDLWLCTTCYACIDRCPQEVEAASIVRALRNLVVKEKKTMPLAYREMASNLMKTGYIYLIPELRIKRREKQGLPPLSKTNPEIIAKIFDMTGLRSILENVKPLTKEEE